MEREPLTLTLKPKLRFQIGCGGRVQDSKPAPIATRSDNPDNRMQAVHRLPSTDILHIRHGEVYLGRRALTSPVYLIGTSSR